MKNLKNIVKKGILTECQSTELYKHHRIALGESDIAQLTLLGCKHEGAVPSALKFGGDGEYHAHLVYDKALIPGHYTLIEKYESMCEFHHMDGSTSTSRLDTWLKIFDDNSLVCELTGKEISVYRAGDYGCLIYVEVAK